MALLDGGLEKWKAKHRGISRADPAFKAVNLTVKARPELVANLSALKQIVADKKTMLIAARPPDEYSGTKADDGVPQGGHILDGKTLRVLWGSVHSGLCKHCD